SLTARPTETHTTTPGTTDTNVQQQTAQPHLQELARASGPPLRSVQFVPGDDPDAVAASLGQRADAVILDLEEPRTPFSEAQRDGARRVVSEFLQGLGDDGGRPLYFVRVQDLDSGQILRDLDAATHRQLAGIAVPKIDGPGDVRAVDAMLRCFEADRGLELGSTWIYPILETAHALRNSYEIAMASPRVAYMGGAVSRFGDIVREIGYRWTAEGAESLYLRSKVLIDARAAGIRYPVSGMWAGPQSDLDGLRRWAEHLRDLGYHGMLLGPPSHIDIVNEVFSPSAEDLERWRSLVATVDAAGDSEDRVYFGDPDDEWHVVHQAHVSSARQGLEWAEALR
ncbi:MAG: aldolase/citrate lyase family protein, partial [Actinomycetota bacterium]|nr:aldolase/citrate lyase family protein [Actinomycetota bacterium]